MPTNRTRVRDLMLEADIDEVEALVALWDAGVVGIHSADPLFHIGW